MTNAEQFHKLFLEADLKFTPFHKYVLIVPPEDQYKAIEFCHNVTFPSCPRLKNDMNPWIHLIIEHGCISHVGLQILTQEELLFIADNIVEESQK